MAQLLRTISGKDTAAIAGTEEPIRAEIFSIERLEQYARDLAAEHKAVVRKRGRSDLFRRLEDNGRKLVAAYRALVETIEQGGSISPAAEWLLDNFHIVEEQLREIRQDLPKGYYRELPKLAAGQLAGYPRIYAVAVGLIAHTDSRLDLMTLRRFISAYQTVAPLTIGELWAVAITLRLALVENLRRLATRIVQSRNDREEADKFADELLTLAAQEPSSLVSVTSERLMRRDKIPRVFVVQLMQRLREQDTAVMPVCDWIEKQLLRQGTSIEQVIHTEHQKQAAAQVTVGNIITSMRLLSTLDWRDFFESVSLVDPILGEDPAAAYANMEFASRDRYRHVVERISKRSKAGELEIAKAAVDLSAAAAATSGADDRQSHVGYYLIDEGLTQLEATFHYQARPAEFVRRWIVSHPTLVYLGTASFLTALIVLFLALMMGLHVSKPMLVAMILLAVISAGDLALSVLNFDLTHLFRPRVLPRMNTTDGVPGDARTMVVIPALLANIETVTSLVEKLEVLFLANEDRLIHFALLGDFRDAPAEEMPDDDALLELALDGIEKLNARYSKPEARRFHLFHRRRRWNPGEQKWMGWERKRGKLSEFNKLLRGSADTSFIVQTAEKSFLAEVRYVITLDADTQLPRDVARRLVGTAIHPLNRPQIDPVRNRVTRGYGILQPRISMSLESASRSSFARIFSGNTGIDPYTTAVSDVYQDLFGEGNYTGKGLYDVDAFEQTVAGRVPENALLSHDLFESLFARAALVTDIELLDDYPAHYDTYAKRQHRWTRGDWQIAGWLFPRVPDAEGRRVRNSLPLIARWKIFDNLRRSLTAPAIVIWLLASWTILPGNSLLWSLFALATLAFPIYLHVTTSLMLHPRGIPWTSHFWSVWGDVATKAGQFALTLTLLAHHALLMMDAIVRTLYRLLISRRNLLEWVTAADAENRSKHDLPAFLRFMWPVELLVLGAVLLIVFARPGALLPASPFLTAWMLSPFIAYLVSRRVGHEMHELDRDALRLARLAARRTWRFFETFLGAEENWLPPDNYQEDPVPLIAHRTSPTNIGLALLATVSAHDFGYASTLEFVERVELTFATLGKLQRFRGHFLNWYDTRTLEPLLPHYVSTVDSGNLAGDLIALKQFCIEAQDIPLFGDRVLHGLADTIQLISEEAARLGTIRQRTEVVTIKHLRAEIETCKTLVSTSGSADLSAWTTLIDSLSKRAAVIEDIVGALAVEHGPESFRELSWWISALRHQLRSLQRDLQTLLPWGGLKPGSYSLLPDAGSETADHWQAIRQLLARVPTPTEIPELADKVMVDVAGLPAQLAQRKSLASDELAGELKALTQSLEKAVAATKDLLTRLRRLAQTCDTLFTEMDFTFLLDADRKMFTIGHNVTEQRPDNSFYDLLASEARLASFLAIAKGDVPQEHWFRMGRQLTLVGRERALISWTGTMFEYLMPLLVMRDYPETLLDQTYRAVLKRQIEYGAERGVPWGISESAYSARDLHLNYQYAPFGVPGLGLKRGLVEDLVVAPYATMLAAMIDPEGSIKNLVRLQHEGALGVYGFYEAIDYTPERLPKNQKPVVVRAFMAHHQGMSLVALDNALHRGAMQKRFQADPLVQATELLLQERIPVGVPATRPRAEEVLIGRVSLSALGMITRVYSSPDLPTPRTQLLSNGTYSVMLTTAGSGYSNCADRAVTRWREDVTRDHWGTFVYLRDVQSGVVWSAGHQPIRRTPQSFEVAFSEDKADYWRTDTGIVTHMEIVVSPEENAEVRQVSVTNNSSRTREIELTSYAEVVLAPMRADAAHPAFSNLFIETQFFGVEHALLARRRQYSPEEDPIWGVHVLVVDGEMIGGVQYETDRNRFLGRGRTPADPIAIMEERPLSNTVGAVLDPVFSLRCRVRLRPNETARVTFTTAVARSDEEARILADKYHDPSIFERQARLAWTRAQVEMTHLNLGNEDAHLFQRLAEGVIYSDAALRPRPHVLALNTKGQSGLWAYGISGDLPIVVVRISKEEDLRVVRKLLRGHEYLHYKGLRVDLVILNEHPHSYIQSLQDELQAMVRVSGLQGLQDRPGGVYLRRADLMPDEDRILLHAVARVVIVADRGSLEEQIERRPVEEPLPPALTPRLAARTYSEPAVAPPELAFFNGLGGFHLGGREYLTTLGEGQWTPVPWANVIANSDDFGFLVTESGAGYSWSLNSHENRLTPWSNDAVSDPPGEIIYLRDEETSELWSPTPLPIREAENYTVRHGQGYTVFEHSSHGISQELLLFVPLDAPVKLALLRLRNRSGKRRVLSATHYSELVLGAGRSQSAPYIITDMEDEAALIFARNPYNNEFADRVAFFGTSEKIASFTCDRKEFIGRNGSHTRPAGLRRTRLAGRHGAGLDPCAAIQTTVELQPGEAREIVFFSGQTESKVRARELSDRYRHGATVSEAFEKVLNYWDKLLSAVEVRTPDPALDMISNRWLLYQTLSCRIRARTAFYQSGGAYGFRDQLQDVMALVYSAPEIARQQILLAARHQFKEGDVQHWWHPPTGRGVRTRCSDDLVWLPFVTAFYINVTGDRSVLDEVQPFIDAPLLGDDELESYLLPAVSAESGSIFEHCIRALNRSLKIGVHGLPLIGSGDWNDGMNRVGHLGQGESVWLAWFLYTTLKTFIPLCEERNSDQLIGAYRDHLETLKRSVEENGWDGDWYRRAYFDDGTPLGSAQNEECRIDSIAQSWGVISGAADPHRAMRSMAAVDEYLVRRGDGLVLLFTPPFDKGNLSPGYIKGYAPGVRENGGQYTHGAIWTMIAFTMLGDGDRGGELFSLLNPINHASTRAGLHKYKVEPYVAAADIYAVGPHIGRGGWTWYSGSAGWMYRAGLESILGFKLRGDRLRIEPCIPRWWRDYAITYRRGTTTYRINVENPHGVSSGVALVEVDGAIQPDREIQLIADGRHHAIRIVLGEAPKELAVPKQDRREEAHIG